VGHDSNPVSSFACGPVFFKVLSDKGSEVLRNLDLKFYFATAYIIFHH
jgi:hypothetical protein